MNWIKELYLFIEAFCDIHFISSDNFYHFILCHVQVRLLNIWIINFGISPSLSNAKIDYPAINSHFSLKIIILGCLNQQFQIDPEPHFENILNTFSQFCIFEKGTCCKFCLEKTIFCIFIVSRLYLLSSYVIELGK